MSAGESVEQLLRRVSPGAYDTFESYEALLRALAGSRLWMLLWNGQAGSPDAQYGNMEVAGYGYAPCVTSAQELTASGWSRAHEVVVGRDIAAALFPDRWGIWLNPHAPGGGVGIPWLDLRRIAVGLDQLPAGPLQISEPTLDIPQFYALLTQNAHHTPAVRSLRRAWVRPALGVPYLAIGLELYDGSPASVEAARRMMAGSVAAAPEGLPVSSVAMADDYDPVAMWLRRQSRPFFDRDAHARAPYGAVRPEAGGFGYGYPRPL
ncbi:enhanced serine sensitivity protein SseB C-terminal domain-containing protein [Streptomyces albus]|uniref:Enhanced serine sensitivity protein SseB n=1 Tax=Streptomyces albus TaxID=1888 RepID=A0A6C1CHI8_9ACTN|nr:MULTISPECIES: enhanced serine sensitivity protein SseB C-terminal domain-containing protein [Streptomyces]MDI6409411.1 enhanced serine sensitivity protein SseB C-terminal domain-containing protein [Streptomyces albus]QID40376.1 enhanced serine sensitivity protein SseB [Streptomyces albus]TGG78170.1 enhanced serine sensitivity protein SseB [Streptomyces albus]UVN54672.1 enhanced serine sensitivity protein SseB C-terminal domain-containing protein [Streptomyces albus]GHJ24663.1 enhanced serin